MSPYLYDAGQPEKPETANPLAGRPWFQRPWFKAVQAIWLVCVAIFLGWYFIRHWEQFRTFSWDIRPGWILAAFALSALRRLFGSLRWTVIALYPNYLRSLSCFIGQMSVYFISCLAIYVPGNVWFVANRIYLGQKSGLSVVKSSLALVYETGVTVWTSIVVASYVGLSLLVSSRITLVFLAAIFLVLSFALFHRRTVDFALNRLEKIAKRPFARTEISTAWVAMLLFISFSILFFGGASLYCVFKALGVENPGSLPYVISALALAWTIGFCAPWAPSGLGVQEGFIIYLFSYLAAPLPALAAVCMRLLYVKVNEFRSPEEAW